MNKRLIIPPFYQSCKYFVCDEFKDISDIDRCIKDDVLVCTHSYCSLKRHHISKCVEDCKYYSSIYKK